MPLEDVGYRDLEQKLHCCKFTSKDADHHMSICLDLDKDMLSDFSLQVLSY